MIGIKMRRSWKLAAAVVVIAAVCAACKGGGEAGGGNQMVEAGDEAAGRDKDGEMAGGDLDGAGAGEENSRRDAGSGDGEGGGKAAEPGNGEGDGGKTAGSGNGERDGGKTGGSGDGDGSFMAGSGDEDGGPEAAGSGDEERGDFTVGTWDGLTFTNPWLKVSITFPQGSKVFSAAKMRALVGTSSEIIVNGGGQGDIEGELSQALNVYDLMVTMPDGKSSVQLAYMNTKKAAPDRDISAADCLEEMAGELSAIGDMGYEISPIEKREIGGQVFDGFSASLMGGALYQEYYGIRAGDHVAILTASYEESGREAVEAVIRGIEMP